MALDSTEKIEVITENVSEIMNILDLDLSNDEKIVVITENVADILDVLNLYSTRVSLDGILLHVANMFVN